MIGDKMDTRSKNIDNLVDMLVSVQRENGIEPTMQEALYDPDTKERINVFKRKKLETSGVDLSKYGASSCNGCKKCSEKKTQSNIERGVFVYNEDDLVDEEDGEYICEYCTKIGYGSSYKPDICDTCDDCMECTDFRNDECDGCVYSSIYNNGMSYGESTNQEYEMNSEDMELMEDIKEGGPDYKMETPRGSFTILDF